MAFIVGLLGFLHIVHDEAYATTFCDYVCGCNLQDGGGNPFCGPAQNGNQCIVRKTCLGEPLPQPWGSTYCPNYCVVQ